MTEGGGETDLIADLLLNPFSRRIFQEKLDIVKKGRATLALASLSQAGKGLTLTCLSTAGHLQAMVLSKTFGETRVDQQLSEQGHRKTELRNEQVKTNREITDRWSFFFNLKTSTSY